jgi:6-phosphogluconolactonase
MSEPRVEVLDDPALAVGALLAHQAIEGGAIALTGGTSVERAYLAAATAAPDWRTVSVWWSDERCVPPADDRSNFGLAKRALLDHLTHLPQVHRIEGELPPPQAAEAYDAALEGVELDLLLLGLGPDGHIASLFPGSSQLRERRARATYGDAGLEPFVDRVTMTLPTLQRARRIVLLVTGAGKARALAETVRGPISPLVPASLLREGDTPIELYADPAAAAAL